jgi:DNA-binding IclR family transcriptional regulator
MDFMGAVAAIEARQNPGVGGAQAVRRAIDVVRAVAQFQRSGANLKRIAVATGLSNSTAFRILRSLTEERMLRYDVDERCYHMGSLAFELGLATHAEAAIQDEWRETAISVARQTRLTTYVMARSDNEAVCLLCEQGSMAIRAVPMDVGQRLPLGIGAGSLAILAALDDDEVTRIVASHDSRLDLFPGRRRESQRILERVAATRENGFAQSSGTVATGLSGIGVSVPAGRRLLRLAVSVSAAVDRIAPSEARQMASIIAKAIRDQRP